ncbi:uncharacterized protein METZ01_LOCUS90172, partial [marine metagenome]
VEHPDNRIAIELRAVPRKICGHPLHALFISAQRHGFVSIVPPASWIGHTSWIGW